MLLCRWPRAEYAVLVSISQQTRCWYNVGPASQTLAQHCTDIGWASLVCRAGYFRYSAVCVVLCHTHRAIHIAVLPARATQPEINNSRCAGVHSIQPICNGCMWNLPAMKTIQKRRFNDGPRRRRCPVVEPTRCWGVLFVGICSPPNQSAACVAFLSVSFSPFEAADWPSVPAGNKLMEPEINNTGLSTCIFCGFVWLFLRQIYFHGFSRDVDPMLF